MQGLANDTEKVVVMDEQNGREPVLFRPNIDSGSLISALGLPHERGLAVPQLASGSIVGWKCGVCIVGGWLAPCKPCPGPWGGV